MKKVPVLGLVTFSVLLVLAPFATAQTDMFEHTYTYAHSDSITAITTGQILDEGEPLVIIGDNGGAITFLDWDGIALSAVDTLSIPDTVIGQIAIVDLDDDGTLEMVVAAYDLDDRLGMMIVYSYEDGAFVEQWQSEELMLPSFAVGNLDDDPALELALLNYDNDAAAKGNDALYIFSPSDGGFVLDYSTAVLDPPGYVSISKPVIADVNGDNTADLFFSNDNGYTWLFNFIGDGYEQVMRLGPADGGASRLAAGDVDGDGVAELLQGSNAGLAEVFSADRNWAFSRDFQRDIGRLAYWITPVDIDGDGTEEFAVSHSHTDEYDDPQVSLFGFVNGAYQELWTTDLGTGYLGIVTYATLNGDSEVQLLIAQVDSLNMYEQYEQ